jgi:hypothetical protein
VLHVSTLLGPPQVSHLLKGTLLHCVISSQMDCYQYTVFSFRVLRILNVVGWAIRFTVCASCVDLQIYGVSIGEWMYWPLTHTTQNTSNFSANANLHNFQITPAPAKLFPACCVFTSRSLATASNSEDSSAIRSQVLSSQTPVQN